MRMKNFFNFLILFFGFFSLIEARKCFSTIRKAEKRLEWSCTRVTVFRTAFDKANKNTTDVYIENSNFTSIPSYSFSKFEATLRSIDIHESQVQTIDTNAFANLYHLEKLVLWGNKLTSVPSEWFANLGNLRILDLSFNKINQIDYRVYYSLPYLNSFNIANNQLKTIDFSLFGLMTQLKTARFGNNPLLWTYRISLAWQLDNQRVDYRDSWDDWGWISHVTQECQNSGYAPLPDTRLLFCGFRKLIEFVNLNLPIKSPVSNDITRNFGNYKMCIQQHVKNVTGDLMGLKVLENLALGMKLTEIPAMKFQF